MLGQLPAEASPKFLITTISSSNLGRRLPAAGILPWIPAHANIPKHVQLGPALRDSLNRGSVKILQDGELVCLMGGLAGKNNLHYCMK